MQLDIGRTVERYRVDALLGQGGLAEVYRVTHTVLGTSHALKVLFLPSPKIKARLVQEGTIQANLRHPNVVAVTDVIDVDGSPGLVLELVDGPPLDLRIEEGPLTLEELDDYARGILAGVAAAHAQGMIHRDLKPGNVLLARSGDRWIPKVTDFGLAKVLGSDASTTKTRSGATLGTPLYMAPEQITDAKNVDVRADVFSLGALLYELATGKRAFEGDDIADTMTRVRDARYIPVAKLRPELPDRMVTAITDALSRDPDRRPADAGELLRVWTGETKPKPRRSPKKPDPTATWDERRVAVRRPTPPTVVIEPLQPVRSLEALPIVEDPSVEPPPAVAPPPPPEEPAEERRVPLWLLGVPLGLAALVVVAVVGSGLVRPARAPVRPPVPAVEAPAVAIPGATAPESPVETPQTVVPSKPRPSGTLRLRTRPVGAEVRLDGRSAGDTADFERRVPAGTHKVVLAAHNSTETTTMTLIVQPDQINEVCWDFSTGRFCD